ncbi:MAG: hypothetical protein MUF78_09850 [Candidatus Edwardsbacteria bacterium]|jgi:hypothetical protein|nr:hypothetical protein [Candidatus Edwardsbacteria bacterium]
MLVAAMALLLTTGCGPGERDREYVRAMRPIVVQYAELAGEIGNNMPEDFAMFSTNIEDLRRQAIMVYPPSGRRLRRFNTDFIDLLRKAKKAGFTFGTVFLDCEEQANAAKEFDGKVAVADKWRWEARESSKDYAEAHQKLKPYMQKTFEYPVGDIGLKEAIDALARRLTQ